MADSIKDFFDGIFGRLGGGQRVVIIFVALAVFAGLISLILFAGKPKLVLLYSNLAVEDANSISSELSAQKIPFELSQDGGAILVPDKDVHKIRLQLASKGLPQGSGVGFEIFDKTNLGMTNFMQQVNYRRALQGELGRTISQLLEIEQARVHIAIPEKSLFIDEDTKEPTASVSLKLRYGKELRKDQVKGIVHLIASSVEGLSPENVTIIDVHGRILSRGKEEEGSVGQLTSNQFEYQRELERSLEKRIESMLYKVLGTEKAIARVFATLDFTKIEQTEEIYLPDTVVRSEQRSSQQASDTQPIASGIPGVVSNIPATGEENIVGVTPLPQSVEKNESVNNQEAETINYEISKRVRHTIEPIGKIKTLSVAVIVDGSYKFEEGNRIYVPRNSEEMQKLTAMVKNAVGYQEERGDDIDVTNIPFQSISYVSPEDAKAMEEEASKQKQIELIKLILKYASIPLLILFVFIFIMRPILRDAMSGGGAPRRRPSYEGMGMEATTDRPLPSIKSAKTAEDIEREIEMQMDSEMEVSPEAMKGTILKKKVMEMVKKDPKTVTQLIRSWLSESSR